MQQRLKLIVAVLAVASLGGCASPHWDYGSYDRDLHRHYTSGGYTEAFIEHLSTHIEQLESAQRPVPPGLYAELGTLYSEAGDLQRTLFYYQREYDHWPESRPFMNSLIQNLTRIQHENSGGASEETILESQQTSGEPNEL